MASMLGREVQFMSLNIFSSGALSNQAADESE
jgi:hypothetical protein